MIRTALALWAKKLIDWVSLKAWLMLNDRAKMVHRSTEARK